MASPSGSAAAGAAQWFIDYTPRDHEIVDYQFHELSCTPGIKFRGPPVDLSAAYFSCIGAAQTLGVYVQKAYPELLAGKLGLPALNLALGAAGPGFYLEHEELIALVNKGRFLVLQVMAARSEANSRLQPANFIELVRDCKSGELLNSGQAWMRLLQEEPESVPAYIAESRASWVAHYRQLLSRIRVPVLLFYFSPKPQDEPPNLKAKTPAEFFGRFPQLVDGASVRAVAALCTAYAECASARNEGHPLLSRFTGKPVEVDYGELHESMRGMRESTNTYYPSPEMHEDAAQTLSDAVRALALPVR